MSFTPVGWWDDGVHPLSQANMKTVDQGLIDAHRGWRPISSGALSVETNSIPIDVPAGFSMVRLHVTGRLLGTANVGVVFNASTNSHRWMFDAFSGDGGRVHSAGTSSSANVTQWGTVVQNALTVHVLDTTGRCTYLADGSRISDTAGVRTRTVGSGGLTSSITLSSLTLVSNQNFNAGAGVLGTSWILEGYRS